MQPISFLVVLDPHRLRKAVDLGFGKANAAAFVPDSHDREAARLGRVHHGVGAIVIGIDHGRRARFEQHLEQPQLGFEIGVEARMIIEMIAGDIGEAAGRDAQTVEPRLIEAMRRGFDGEMRHAFAGKFVDRAVQRDRIGRRQRAVSLTARRHDPDGADACSAAPERGPDLPREGGHGRFAAGAGDGSNDARLSRMEFCRDQRQRAPRIADAHEGDVLRQWRLRPLLGNDGGSAGGDCGRPSGGHRPWCREWRRTGCRV